VSAHQPCTLLSSSYFYFSIEMIYGSKVEKLPLLFSRTTCPSASKITNLHTSVGHKKTPLFITAGFVCSINAVNVVRLA
jgi:hypothetical protein